MKYRLIVFFIAILFLAGCSSKAATQDQLFLPDGTKPPQESQTDKVAQITIAIKSTASLEVVKAAELFASQLSGAGSGQVNISIKRDSDPLGQIKTKKAQFAFVDSFDYKETDAFDALSKPFLYKDYLSFALGANSTEVYSLIKEEVKASYGATPLAAFYTPSRHLLSSFQIEPYSDLSGVAISLDKESDSSVAFDAAGATVDQLEDNPSRLRWVQLAEERGAEFYLADLAEIDFVSQERQLYLTMSYHTISPLFLLTDTAFFEGIESTQKANILEAVAGLYSQIDEKYLEKEEEYLLLIEKKGVVVEHGLERVRTKVWNVLRQDAALSPSVLFVLDIV